MTRPTPTSSCPDWQRLAAERDADPLVDPASWQKAREHLAGCADCRASAAAIDPLFVFAALPPAAVSAPAERDLAMESAVFALVRASRVAPDRSATEDPAATVRTSRSARAMKVAAALLLASLLGFVGSGSGPRPAGTGAIVEAPGDPASNLASLDEAAAAVLAAEGSEPAVEEIDRPEARVYDLSRADLAVVMIVDSSLDV